MALGRKITPFIKQCFVTAAVGLNITGGGCVIGFPAILLPQLNQKDSLIKITKDEQSWIAGILPLSLLLGTFLSPPLTDRLGRKRTHYVLTVVFLTGWYITILATSFKALIIGRFCQGIGVGLLGTLRSILIGEYTSPRNRGAFLTTVALAQAFGIFFVHLVGSFMYWQTTALVCVFLPFISLLMVIYTPESPSWLLSKGRYDECREVFRWLRGNDEEEELEHMIRARVAYEQAEVKELTDRNWFGNLLSKIREKEFYKPIIIATLCQATMHVSGGTTMASYATMIIGVLMGPNANVYFWMVFVDTQRIIVNACAVYVINRVKRRTMVLSTGLWSAASHIAIAIYVYSKLKGWEYDAVWLPVLLINCQFFAVAAGTVPMPSVISGEIFPLEYRNVGGTISIAAGGGMMFLVLKTFPDVVGKAGLHGTYTLYGVILATIMVVMFVWLPETKGKTLQQIEDELRGRPLTLEEIQSRESLRSNPVMVYKRKISDRSYSPVVV